MRISTNPSAVQITVDQKQPENVTYFNYLVNMMTNDAKCTRGIKARITTEKVAFKKKFLFTSKLDLKFKEETSKVLHLEHSFVWCWKLDTSESRLKKYFGSSEKMVMEKGGEDQLEGLCEKLK
jgi:hypothetical protein